MFKVIRDFMPKFILTDDTCDRIEKIIGKKLYRGGNKMINEALDILENKKGDSIE